MKLMIVIVKDQDADTLTQELTAASFRVTRVASTGGFLRSGIVTLLMGLEDDQVDEVIGRMRARLASTTPGQPRATLFVVPVEHFEQV
jgi:uncharacterized protein YaaQ